MPNEETTLPPGAALAITLLDDMIKNGTDPAMKAIGEGVKASIVVSCKNNDQISKHINDDNVHTFLGIIKQKGVLQWIFGAMLVMSFLVEYVPELAKWIIGLF